MKLRVPVVSATAADLENVTSIGTVTKVLQFLTARQVSNVPLYAVFIDFTTKSIPIVQASIGLITFVRARNAKTWRVA
jgi:hypothetical protein